MELRAGGPRALIHTLVGIVAKGGNLLLNIGPTPEGELPPDSVRRLKEIGEWMKVNGSAIYSTRAIAPYAEGRMRFTRSADGSINAIYLADENETRLPETIPISSFVPSKGSAVTMLGGRKSIAWKKSERGFVIRLSESARAHPPCRYAWTFRFKAE